jgi:hypothetical protein
MSVFDALTGISVFDALTGMAMSVLYCMHSNRNVCIVLCAIIEGWNFLAYKMKG